jgi:hypothetical protein
VFLQDAVHSASPWWFSSKSSSFTVIYGQKKVNADALPVAKNHLTIFP